MKGKLRRRGALRSTEGHLLLAGVGLSLLYLSWLSASALISPDLAQGLVGITATNVLFGRAAGMSLAYALGYGHAGAIPLNMLIETILVLLFYPLFVFSLNQLLELESLGRYADRTVKAAEKHRDKVERYGIPGLVLFVWFPFTMTGPLVGCAIGYIIGLRPWVTISVVLGSTWLAIICWGLLLRDLLEGLQAYSTYAPLSFVAALIALFILLHFVRLWKKRKRA